MQCSKMNTQNKHLVLALLLSCFALSYGDLYGNPPAGPVSSSPIPQPSPPTPTSNPLAPPPPFKVAGKEFPPENSTCDDPKTRCFGKTLTCPAQCPQIKPADPKAKACFLDCDRPSCEQGTCRIRKPNCEGKGAACYDPRFIGGDGIMFYFHGKADHHFALVSDFTFQINARFIGLRPAGRPRDFTWIQSLGVLFGSHSFTLAANKVSSWDHTLDHFSFSYDGTPLDVDEGYLSSWTSPTGLSVERTAMVNSVTVTLPGTFEIMASIVPVTQEDDRIHKYHIPEDDCFAHLEVQFKFFMLSEKVEGVLGQTYRPDFANPVKRGVSMPIMSGEERYIASSLLSPTCRYCIFSPDVAEKEVALEMDPAKASMDCTSKMSNGYGVVCRR